MLRRLSERRIGLLGSVNGPNGFEFMRGVVEYRQHAEHFRVVGPDRAPMRPLDQIDLTAVDGVLGYFHTPKEAQVERAKCLLTSTDMPIEQISSESGFRQPARLNQVFKRHTGLTPGQYRRERKRGLI